MMSPVRMVTVSMAMAVMLGGCVVRPAPASPPPGTQPPPPQPNADATTPAPTEPTTEPTAPTPPAVPDANPDTPPPQPPTGLTATDPVDCSGANTRTLERVHIVSTGTAIDVHGACKITIKDSHIVGNLAIDAHGAANLTITNSVIEGKGGMAIDLHGSARVTATGTRFVGKMKSHGAASFGDQGGNSWK